MKPSSIFPLVLVLIAAVEISIDASLLMFLHLELVVNIYGFLLTPTIRYMVNFLGVAVFSMIVWENETS